jgi:UPF0716 protein FxsA
MNEVPMMFLRLISLFVLVPLVELYLLIKVGTLIGVWPTVGIVVITGIAGGVMARRQGFTVLNSIRESLNRGVLPAGQVVDGLFILAGGLMLLTPGLMTDMLGFLALLPSTRAILKRWIKQRFQRLIDSRMVYGEYHIEE